MDVWALGDAGLAAVLWTVFVLYAVSVVSWILEVGWFSRGWQTEEFPYDASDARVRIMTVNATEVVRRTVDAVPAKLGRPQVITEEDIDVPGADVFVVPEEFECVAERKGRALEWARQNVPCNREFVLYLDEDTLITDVEGFPDADIVQFSERPVNTGSRLAYLTDVFRLGYHLEQRAFHRLSAPLYAWGGGIAVRREFEDAVTWDRRTLIEDTKFAWQATNVPDFDFRLLRRQFVNQAPPSLTALVKQRRRWMSGSREDAHGLPRRYWLFYGLRNAAWGLSLVMPVFAVLSYLRPGALPYPRLYTLGTMCLLVFLFAWSFLGARAVGASAKTTVLAVLLTPVTNLLHSVGAAYGVLFPPRTFEVTEKVAFDDIPEDEEQTVDLEDVIAEDHGLDVELDD
ncbi:glycosyltransferase family 2 protein [Salarchaeum japonicum]|uniref:glycosyltransferase family 2 protein n=1 Tax=Salarchaeum japonicum TaxID=555573 RepID=UPI003C76985D